MLLLRCSARGDIYGCDTQTFAGWALGTCAPEALHLYAVLCWSEM